MLKGLKVYAGNKNHHVWRLYRKKKCRK